MEITFQEWFYTGVSQNISDFTRQNQVLSNVVHMYYYTIVKKKISVTISRVHSLFHCLQIFSNFVSISISSFTFSSIQSSLLKNSIIKF